MVGTQSGNKATTKSGGGGKKGKAVDTKQSSILRWFGAGSNAAPRPPPSSAVASEGKAAENTIPPPPLDAPKDTPKDTPSASEAEAAPPTAAPVPSPEVQAQACASPANKAEVEVAASEGTPSTGRPNNRKRPHPHTQEEKEEEEIIKEKEKEEEEEKEEAAEVPIREDTKMEEEKEEEGMAQGSSEGEGGVCMLGQESVGVGEGDEEGLSAFERERLANIRANQAFLASLGLASLQPSTLLGTEAGSKKRSKKRKERAPSPPRHKGPVRRSGRNRTTRTNTVAEEGEGEDGVMMEEEEEEEEEVDYDDSTVVKYMCHDMPTTTGCGGGVSPSLSALEGQAVRGFSSLGYGGLQDPCLSAIYSMHLHHNPTQHNNRPPLAAGGKQGRVCIFSAPRDPSPITEEEEEEGGGGRGKRASGVLLSFQGHRGWVCDVRWLPVGGPCLLLVSGGNDGLLKLWDVNKTTHSKTSGHMPKLLQALDRVHSKGIFSLDSCCEEGQGIVASGGKDGVAALSTLDPTGSLTLTHTYDDVHEGVVKAVRLRDRHTLAVGGDDRTVQVLDVREGGGSRLWVGQDLHTRTVHSIRFQPNNEYVMVTAGLDPVIKLWDLRKASSNASTAVSPLALLSGHVSSLAPPKLKDMHHPEFYAHGRYLLSCGERAQRLSIYDVSTGTAVSRGQLSSEGILLCPRPDCADLLVVDRQGHISTLRPFLEQ